MVPHYAGIVTVYLDLQMLKSSSNSFIYNFLSAQYTIFHEVQANHSQFIYYKELSNLDYSANIMTTLAASPRSQGYCIPKFLYQLYKKL